MKGRTTGQHILPQFLLKGFVSRTRKAQRYAFLAQRGRTIVESNIKNIGKQRLFYGENAENGLENALAEAEGAYAAATDSARETGVLSQDTMPLIVEMIVNLALRTNHLRAGLADEGRTFADHVAGTFASQTGAAFIREYVAGHQDEVIARLREELGKGPSKAMLDNFDAPTQQKLRGIIEEIAASTLQQHISLEQLQSVAGPFFSALSGQLDWTQVAADGHKSALAELVSPGGLVEYCRRMRWVLLSVPDHTLVIGDFGPLARRASDEVWSPLSTVSGAAELVLLPISHRLAVVGSAGVDSLELNALHLLEDTARLSRDFFVASRSGDLEMAAIDWIGTRSQLFEPGLAEKALSGAMARVLSRSTSPGRK